MRPSKEVTIYDIARVLNISPATVSRGLKDHPAIRQDTKDRIVETARKMGYRHNSFARNLRQQRTNTIGVIVHRLSSYFISTVIAGMENALTEAGYNLIISQSMESYKKEVANSKTMFNSRVDGLMISLAYDTDDFSHISPFLDKRIPVLLFDRIIPQERCSSVVIDNYSAAYDLTTHLLEQGARTLAHVTGNLKRNVYQDRLMGYKKALEDFNLPFSEDNIIICDLNEEAGIQAGHQLLNMHPRPDGVFVANDACAAFCMRTVKENGICIPGEMAFTGFNDDPISRVIDPNLTTVHYSGKEMGETAARELIRQLTGTEKKEPQTIHLGHQLIIRQSSQKKEVKNDGVTLRELTQKN